MANSSSAAGISTRLSLAFRNMDEIHPRVIEKFGGHIRELDLSNNNLS